MKFYFLSSIGFAVILGLLALNDSLNKRMILLVLALVLFYMTLLLFTFEYDKQNSNNWKKKEKKLVANTYLDFLNKHYKKEKINQ